MSCNFKDLLIAKYGSQRNFCECSNFKGATVRDWVNGASVPSAAQNACLAQFFSVSDEQMREIFCIKR